MTQLLTGEPSSVISFKTKVMKRLWAFVLLGLMIMVQPVYSTASITENSNVVPADVPQSFTRRIYGENIALEIYSDVGITEYRDFVQKFTENGSRWIMDYTMATEGANYYARLYLMQQLELLSNGRIEVDTVGDHFNVVGRLPGYLPGEHPVIVVSAHYDSAQNSPGANADGSGIASVLCLARIFSQYEWPLDIYFIAFNGLLTFAGMEGSPEVATKFQLEGIEILTMYNVDTLLVQDPLVPLNERIQMGYTIGGQQDYHKSQYWAELARMMSNNYGSNYVVPTPSANVRIWESSDHITFYERGFTGVLCAYESGGFVDGISSTTSDRWDNTNFNYNLGRETTGVIGASIAFTMSRRYGAPIHLAHYFSKGSGQMELLQFAITTPTIVNITARWFGGSSSYYLQDPDLNFFENKTFTGASPWEPVEIYSQQLTTKGTYLLFAHNTDFRSVGYDVTISYDSDIENNGVLDKDEYWLDQIYFESDQDNDNVSDAEEIFLGTDMNDEDSDGDIMDDRYEIDMGFDPTDPSDGSLDADSDGLSNAQEYSGGLNPFSSDSDNDLMDDLWELTNGLNPLVDDANLDPDEDNMTNLEEYLAGTDPQVKDVESIPMILFASSVVVIAPIVGLLYLRRKNIQLLS